MKRRTIFDDVCRPSALRIELQPIVTVSDHGVELYALEALTHGPSGTNMESPSVLFEYARRMGRETELDLLCIAEILAIAGSLPGQPVISINVHGSTLGGTPNFAKKFIASALEHGIAPKRLMLEIVEHRAPWAIQAFQTTLYELREAGIRIALDDLGVGASNYHLFIDCRPDHIKIDRYIIDGCSNDAWRLAVLRSIVTLCEACGAVAIAEGVETEADLAAIRAIGIHCVQGWLYARSMPAADIVRSGFLD